MKKEDEKPSSSKSDKSILKAEDWHHIEKLLKKVVIDVYDERTRKLNDIMMAISTENILLKLQCDGLEKALVIKQK